MIKKSQFGSHAWMECDAIESDTVLRIISATPCGTV